MKFDIHTHNISNERKSILNGYDVKNNTQIFSIGIHPWDSDENFKFVNIIRSLLSSDLCVAIGECGLDKIKGPDISIQISTFREQIKLSEQFQLPVIIHCVRAFNELIQLKKKFNQHSLG